MKLDMAILILAFVLLAIVSPVAIPGLLIIAGGIIVIWLAGKVHWSCGALVGLPLILILVAAVVVGTLQAIGR